MSIKGFIDQNGLLQKYDYNAIENKPDYDTEIQELSTKIDNDYLILSNLSDVAIINAWVQGGVDANGNDVNSEQYIRTDFLLLRKGEVYIFNIDGNYLCQIFYYNSTKGFIGFSEQFDGQKEINSLNNDVIQNGYIKLVLQTEDLSNIVPDDGNTNVLIAFRSVLISSVRQNSEAISQNSEAIVRNFNAIIGKLDENQGTANAGKILVVGEDGTVEPRSIDIFDFNSF